MTPAGGRPCRRETRARPYRWCRRAGVAEGALPAFIRWGRVASYARFQAGDMEGRGMTRTGRPTEGQPPIMLPLQSKRTTRGSGVEPSHAVFGRTFLRQEG